MLCVRVCECVCVLFVVVAAAEILFTKNLNATHCNAIDENPNFV